MEAKHLSFKTSDNFTLEGELRTDGKSKSVVILVHGLSINRDKEATFVRAETELNSLGIATFRFDMRAHGKSEGVDARDFTITGALIDFNAAVELMKAQGFTTIGLGGASFMGSVAALYAGLHPEVIAALLLLNPVLDYQKTYIHPTIPSRKEEFTNLSERLEKYGYIEIGSRKFKMSKEAFREMEEYSPCTTLQQYEGPLLIIHGDKDEKVPLRDVADCFVDLPSSNKQFEEIKGGEHGFHKEPFTSEVSELISDFFKNNLNEQVIL